MNIRLGVRGSKLALAYADIVKTKLLALEEVSSVDIVVVKTQGDIQSETAIAEIGGKGVFVKAIEQELLINNVDIAVHSFKDLPKDMHEDLEVAGVMPRHDPRDVVIGSIFNGCVIGSSSPRRTLQLKKKFPNCTVKPIRGNIDTRIEKLRDPDTEYNAIVLAKAGLDTLGLTDQIDSIFAVNDLIPAAGQGVIAVQTRKNDSIKKIVDKINDEVTFKSVMAERYMLLTLDGDCHSAIGSIASVTGNVLLLTGYNFEKNKTFIVTGDIDDYKNIGTLVGEMLL